MTCFYYVCSWNETTLQSKCHHSQEKTLFNDIVNAKAGISQLKVIHMVKKVKEPNFFIRGVCKELSESVTIHVGSPAKWYKLRLPQTLKPTMPYTLCLCFPHLPPTIS